MKNPAVLQTWRRAELEARAEEVRGKPIALQLGPAPEGYPEWLAAQARAAPTVNDDTTPPERPASLLQRRARLEQETAPVGSGEEMPPPHHPQAGAGASAAGRAAPLAPSHCRCPPLPALASAPPQR